MSQPSKAHGKWDKASGSVKGALFLSGFFLTGYRRFKTETVGSLFGSESMQTHGVIQHAKGDAEVSAARVVEGVQDERVGTTKVVVGASTGNPGMQAEGESQRFKGQLKQDMNANRM